MGKGGRPTEDWMFSQVYATGAACNDTHFNHEKFNKLLIEARAELDEGKRRSMYWEMQKILIDEGGVIVFAFPSYLAAGTKELKSKNLAGN